MCVCKLHLLASKTSETGGRVGQITGLPPRNEVQEVDTLAGFPVGTALVARQDHGEDAEDRLICVL